MRAEEDPEIFQPVLEAEGDMVAGFDPAVADQMGQLPGACVQFGECQDGIRIVDDGGLVRCLAGMVERQGHGGSLRVFPNYHRGIGYRQVCAAAVGEARARYL